MEYDLKVLKINKNKIEQLNELSIYTVKDLVQHYPYRFEEMLETPLHDESKVIIEAQLIDEPKIFYKGRFSRLTFHVNYHEEPLTITIFNRHFLKKNMQVGMMLTIIGKYSASKKAITASDLKLKSLKEISGITPVYSLKEGLTQKSFQGYVNKALNFYKGHIANTIPLYLCQKYHLIDKEDALFKIHQPQTRSDVISALRYLKYEEFFKFQMTMQYIKQNRTQNIGISKLIDKEKVTHFIEKLTFQLTDDQKKVIDDILIDLTSQKLMYRFVQGDVGSGKTVVAAISLYANYLAGYQGAMMAPTEILALQHYQSLKKMFKKYKINIALLTGHLSQKEKNDIYQQLENGQIDIIIGTHALFQEKVQYNQLGLVITDEQHRFGVEQRKALKDKGNKVDFLVMTATPIPRTLAITMNGDLDLTIIDELPSGRKPILTTMTNSRKQIASLIRREVEAGRQAYIVYPLIEESETLSAKAATIEKEKWQNEVFPEYKIGLLHGKLKNDEKDEVMNKFKNKEYDILVSTTVVEVGVDVPNATVIVIENAERFGLSQLHQLRGRVGRSDLQSYCVLSSSTKSQETRARLDIMTQTNDGFVIAEKDLQIRGPGEFLGTRQSGLPDMIIADIVNDAKILELARAEAIDFVKNNNIDDYPLLKEAKGLNFDGDLFGAG